MNKKNVFIIGSCSSEEYDNGVAAVHSILSNSVEVVKKWDIDYVIPNPTIPLPYLIEQCYDSIDRCDVLVCVKKMDGSIGNDTLYELLYAKRKGRQVIFVGADDSTNVAFIVDVSFLLLALTEKK